MKRVIGLMSGTSLDGVDAALIETDGEGIRAFGAGTEIAYTTEDRSILQDAVDRALDWGFEGDKSDFTAAEDVLTRTHVEAVHAVLESEALSAPPVELIGFHGQTVLHKAPKDDEAGQTLQIGDGEALAKALGIPVVYDFRSADMQKGGQGAPLAPLYHRALALDAGLSDIAVLNLGGVANVTWLEDGQDPIAFDTGPANGLIDAWCQDLTDKSHDEGGKLACAGAVDLDVLAQLMSHEFFPKAAPKSLDRWDFSLAPARGLSLEDGAATLTRFTARTVADAVRMLGEPSRVLVTGGGRHNETLMGMLEEELPRVQVEPVEAVGWRGDFIEAEAFAWLAARFERGLPTSLPSTTGVSEPVCGGVKAKP